jgi:hypothetical protein
MKSTRVGIVSLLVALMTTAVRAEPLDVTQVAKDAQWVMHVDADAILASKLVTKAWEKVLELRPEAEQRLGQLRDQVGIDVQKDIHSVTAYGLAIGQPSGVTIVHAKIPQSLVMPRLERLPDYKATQVGGQTVHSWTMPGRRGLQSRTVAGVFYKPEVIVLASGEEELTAALDVIAAKASAPGLRQNSPLAAAPPAGTAVLFRAVGVSQADLPPQLALAAQIDSVQVALGEKEGELFLQTEAVMTDAQAVEQAKSLIDGALAFARLQIREDDEAKKLIDALKIGGDGKTLTIAWSAPSDQLIDTIERQAKTMAERRRARAAERARPEAAPER